MKLLLIIIAIEGVFGSVCVMIGGYLGLRSKAQVAKCPTCATLYRIMHR